MGKGEPYVRENIERGNKCLTAVIMINNKFNQLEMI